MAMSGGDAWAELGVRPLLGVSGYWMARLDPKRSCGKDTGVRGLRGHRRRGKCGGGGAYRRRGGSAPTPGTRAARLRVLGWRRGGMRRRRGCGAI